MNVLIATDITIIIAALRLLHHRLNLYELRNTQFCDDQEIFQMFALGS
jgi:hypothetical protein